MSDYVSDEIIEKLKATWDSDDYDDGLKRRPITDREYQKLIIKHSYNKGLSKLNNL